MKCSLLFVVVLVVTTIKSDGKKAKPREPEHKNHKKSCDSLPHVQKKNDIQIAKKKCQQRKHLTPIQNQSKTISHGHQQSNEAWVD